MNPNRRQMTEDNRLAHLRMAPSPAWRGSRRSGITRKSWRIKWPGTRLERSWRDSSFISC